MKHKSKNKRMGMMGAKIDTPGPLADQILGDQIATPSVRIKRRDLIKKKKKEYVDGDLGHNIMQQSAAQLKEMNEEDDEYCKEWPALGSSLPTNPRARFSIGKHGGVPSRTKDSSDEEAESDNEDMDGALLQNVDVTIDSFKKEMGIDYEDGKILEHFSKRDPSKQQTLADLFRDKITEKQSEIQTQIDADSVRSSNLSPEIKQICLEIGVILSKYKSGSVPKIFKVFPKMRCWEELVYMTSPEKWTAASMYQATRLFVSNQHASMAQRFFHLVLLPRVRDDIHYYKRLNPHLYKTLFKAFFKPPAFFKGILIPLCAGGDCTLREAIIIGSVIAKCRIPIVHSAAAILKLAELEYSGATSIFLRIFFNKRYVLPYRVIDAIIHHFVRFTMVDKEFSVLWHQSLLVFVQRYKNDISSEQKSALFKLVTKKYHPFITDEIRKELQASKCRDAAVNEKMEVELDSG